MSKLPAAARAARRERAGKQRRTRILFRATAGVVIAAVVAVVAILVLSPSPPSCVRVGPDTIGKKKFPAPPCDELGPDRRRFYLARVQTTLGEIVIYLDPAIAPKSVNNFVFLARTGFFEGQTFRVDVKPDHAVVQAGDPAGNGRGNPGYTYAGETPSPITRYVRGVVAMANTGTPSSNGSQFFIVVRDYEAISTPATTPRFTFFGFVSEETSLAVLDKMVAAPLNGNRPVTPIVITKVTIQDTALGTSPTPSPSP